MNNIKFNKNEGINRKNDDLQYIVIIKQLHD